MNFIFQVDLEVEKLSQGDRDKLIKIAFEQFGCLGQCFFDFNEGQIEEILGEKSLSGGKIADEILDELEEKAYSFQKEIKLYFPSEEGGAFFKKFQKKFNMKIKKLENQDWGRAWQSSFKKIEISPGLQIVPEWEKEKDEKSSVFIYPGMGFGTGTHETTFLCLKVFDDLYEKGLLRGAHYCLDFGCGSGILGIAALKRALLRVDFVDKDRDALDNCLHNLKINQFQKYAEGHSLVLRDRFKTGFYDLVFANILENVLIEEIHTLLKVLKKGSFLIISGILSSQIDSIKQAYSGLEVFDCREKGDWACLCLRK